MLSNSLKTINLAIDVFGADDGEKVIIEGCDLIADNISACFIFIGRKSVIEPIIHNC